MQLTSKPIVKFTMEFEMLEAKILFKALQHYLSNESTDAEDPIVIAMRDKLVHEIDATDR